MKKTAAVCAMMLSLGQVWAEGLYIHQETHNEELCYLTNSQGQRLFQGAYQQDCFAIRPHQAVDESEKHSQSHAVLNMFEFRGQKSVAINAQGQVLYHIYWYDNGPDYVEDGLVRIRNAQGLVGYADGHTGQVVIAPQYFCAEPFEQGKALVSFKGRLVKEDGFDHQSCIPTQVITIDKQGRPLP